MKLFEVNPSDAKLILTESSITHIDDQKLSIEKFIEILKDIAQFEVTEKIDGSNLWFGLDMQGNYYTSRGAKEGGEYYRPEDWGNDFKDTGFKSAHEAIESKIDLMKDAGLQPGDIIEIEILFGEKPNAIPYWPNQIIFIRVVTGEPDLEQISKSLEGKSTTITANDVPYTDDGQTIERRNEEHTWTFSEVQKYDVDTEKLSTLLLDYINKLEIFLYAPNIANLELTNKEGEQSTPTNLEVLALRATRPEYKEAKEIVRDVIDGERDPEIGGRTGKSGIRFDVKEILLNELVRNAQSTLGPTIEEGGWIEGVVLRKKGIEKDDVVKVVDKDIFTAVNEFNHQVRSFLTKKHAGTESERTNVGILGNLLRDMATAIGYPVLGTTQAKRHLKNIEGDTQEKLENLAKGIDVGQVKTEWNRLLDRAEKITKDILDQYQDQKYNREFVDAAGRKHKYEGEIDKRTLQTFAALFRDISTWKNAINEIDTAEELLLILIGDKI